MLNPNLKPAVPLAHSVQQMGTRTQGRRTAGPASEPRPSPAPAPVVPAPSVGEAFPAQSAVKWKDLSVRIFQLCILQLNDRSGFHPVAGTFCTTI